MPAVPAQGGAPTPSVAGSEATPASAWTKKHADAARAVFTQGRARTGSSGDGLGMAHEMAAGSKIESKPGNGTTIRLVFLSAPRFRLHRSSSALQLTARSLRILVVDDDPVLNDRCAHASGGRA